MSCDWDAVYRATFPDLVRFLHRKVWDEDRARELAQEAFVRALREKPEPERPRPWLFTVAANLARDEARHEIRRRNNLTLLKSEVEAEDSRAEDPASVLERRERTRRVRRALDTLSDRDQEVILLWDAGMSYQEIAQATGLAPGAIGTTLARARQRLVRAYEEEEKVHVALD
ncbi:MAG: RNA polymerase sigma factor [Gemmatimonadota bacterium]